MSPNQLALKIEEVILAADARFASSITSVQNLLYDELLSVLKNLELDPDGYIIQNGANRKILAEAEAKLQEVYSSQKYQSSVQRSIFAINKIDELNQTYFSALPAFKDNKIFLKSLQTQTVQTVEKYILQDGLQSQVIEPLNQIMNQNINIGGKFSGMLDQLRTYIKGNIDVEGRALSYSRNFLKDSLFQYSRGYQESVTADLKLDWYLYSGGLIDTSREFCIERAGRYFRRSEIESWAGLTWAGRHRSTSQSSIFIFCGGYGCTHSLIPVHESIVPVEFK